MKKNLLTVLILALLIVNIVLSSVMIISVLRTNNKTADLVYSIASVLDLELSGPRRDETQDISVENIYNYSLADTLRVLLRNDDGTESKNYILFDLTLRMNTANEDYAAYETQMANKEGFEGNIQGIIYPVVAARTEAEYVANVDLLRKDILEAIQKELNTNFIYDVAVSGVTYYSG